MRPTDPIELLQWIRDRRQFLDKLEREALFEARLEGSFEDALRLTQYSRKQALAQTRHENERRGRMVRWNSN